MNQRHLGDDGLEQLLERYAVERLALSPAATARLRAHLLEQAAARSGAPQRPWRTLRRSFALLAAAAIVATLTGGAVATSGPGGPLYPARLWVETVTLPGEPGARTDAELTRLQVRLDEAAAAASSGNGAALSAAIEAYGVIVDEALAAAGDDLDREARLELHLQRHQVVLQTLADRVPDAAKDAIGRALERSDKALSQISKVKPGGGNGQATPPGPDGSGPPGQLPGGPSHSPPGSP
jgi:hypothetical protein